MNTNAQNDVFQQLNKYVNEVFAELRLDDDWSEFIRLPLYLQGGYTYRNARLQDQTCLLMLDLGNEQTDKAAALKKQIKTIAQYFHGPVIYVVKNITSFNRKRLVEQRIPFIVPGKQLYLPFAAIDLRDHFTATGEALGNTPKHLSPVAQQVVLLNLYHRWDENTPAQQIAKQLSVSKMTVSRAYAELSDCGLANMITTGRQKQLRFMTRGVELWKQALPFLRDPVKKQVWIDHQTFESIPNPFGIEAGETALSKQGMIMAAKYRTVAVNAKDWPSLKKLLNIVEQAYAYGDCVGVELWRYDPSLLSENGTVDPLSLYLSLNDKVDDRMAIEKDELLKKVWSTQ